MVPDLHHRAGASRPAAREILRTVKANKSLLFLVLFAILSMIWSEDAGLTIRRGFAVLATTLFGLDFAVRYSIREQVRMFGIALWAWQSRSAWSWNYFMAWFPPWIPLIPMHGTEPLCRKMILPDLWCSPASWL